jgi:hypothetical protein
MFNGSVAGSISGLSGVTIARRFARGKVTFAEIALPCSRFTTTTARFRFFPQRPYDDGFRPQSRWLRAYRENLHPKDIRDTSAAAHRPVSRTPG